MDDIDALFSAEGPLADAIADYRPRPQQRAMAVAVADALSQHATLLVEAGTGIGKTFAYLVPALLSGRQVAISTGTRTLQDQLFNRDLPRIAGALGRPVKVALLKGRANYLCLHRAETARFDKRLGGAARRALTKIQSWGLRTTTGDISEVSGVPEDAAVWPRVTSTAENCLGQECEFYSRCHVVLARRAAQAADVVVVNHHLLMADLALKDGGFGELLPGADAVIIDEAHQLPETATQFFGTHLSSRRIDELVRDLMTESASLPQREQIWSSADALKAALSHLRLALGGGQQRTRLDNMSDDISSALAGLQAALAAMDGKLGKLAAGESAGLESCRRRLLDCQTQLALLQEDASEEGLRWADISARGFTLHLTPFDVAGNLRDIMSARPCAWVFTSATLAVGDNFEHFSRRIGAEKPTVLRLDSPFDFASQSRLFLPAGMPDPGSPEYTCHVVESALPLIQASQGRAFLLFTSHRALREAATLLEERLDFPLLIQGSAPREELLVRFRAMGNAVLLGTSSFWEGVDVRGPALSLVVIDKLPFASPGDPVLQARLEAIRRTGGNPFTDYQLPQAVLALKQGVGRLIRDHKDAGVAMLCDPRLGSRSYGRLFLKSLPPMTRSRSSEEVCVFLAAHRAAHPMSETA